MELLKLFENIRSPFLDTVMGLVTRLGEEALAMAVLCLIFWCVNKRAAYVMGVAFFFSGLSVQGMKICFRIDRPWVIDPALKPVASALENATGYSFPSGHVQCAAALFGSLGAEIKRKWVKALCFFTVLLVAFSRLYLGVHTLLDVAVSLVITLALVVATRKVLAVEPAGEIGGGTAWEIIGEACGGTAWENVAVTIGATAGENFDEAGGCKTAGGAGGAVNKKREFTISLVMALFAVAVIIIAAALYSGNIIEQSYVADCLKAAGAGVGFAVGMFVERVYIGFSVKAKNILWQAGKFVIGFAGVLAIKEGLKLLIGAGLFADMFRYFLMIAWVTVLFPLIIKKAVFRVPPGTLLTS